MAAVKIVHEHQTFAFPLILQLTLPLDFNLPSLDQQPSSSSKKRRRQSCEISQDEPILPSNKKRRLRLVLCTSRLSRPFSFPASHIAEPGGSRVAIFSKSRNPNFRGRSLRRAAIINLVRRNSLESEDGTDEVANALQGWNQGVRESLRLKDMSPEDDERGEATLFRHSPGGSCDPSQRAVGPSNYEALDDWRGYFMIDFDQDEELPEEAEGDVDLIYQVHDEDEVVAVYDFNFITPVVDSCQVEDEEYDDVWATLPADWYDDAPTKPSKGTTHPGGLAIS